MVEIGIIQEWVAKADEDFEFALVNLKEGKPLAGLPAVPWSPMAPPKAGKPVAGLWLILQILCLPPINPKAPTAFLSTCTTCS